MKLKYKLLFFFVICIGILYFFNTESSSEKSGNKVEKTLTNSHSINEAYSNSKRFVKMMLKTPSTAEFPWKYDSRSYKINDSTFRMYGYVDSQNSFGSKLRTMWTCTVVFRSDNTVECKEVKLFE
jgi:hypothetical protein